MTSRADECRFHFERMNTLSHPAVTRFCHSFAAGLLIVGSMLLAVPAAGQPLSAGAARVEITPSTHLLNWVGHQPYDGVLDPIFVRALVLSDSESNRVAILCWDLVDTREAFVAKVRSETAKATGISETNILIKASHTHSAPWAPVLDSPLLAAERKTMSPVEQGPTFREWAGRLPEQCADAVRRADAARRPATLAIGCAWAGEAVFNRRPVRTDGKVETTFTPANPYSLPAGLRFGPTDPTVTLLMLRDDRGQAIAALFHLACHPVSIYPFHKGISADWPGAVATRLQTALGGEALFLQGCAGDIVPARRGLAARDEMARLISERALAAVTNSQVLNPSKLRTARVSIALPLTAAAQRDLGSPALKTEVHVINFGSLALVALPGEPLIGLAMEIQRRSPFPHTLVLGYSNGGGVQYVGLPGDKAKGGYEMTEAGAGTDDCGRLLIEAATGLLCTVGQRQTEAMQQLLEK